MTITLVGTNDLHGHVERLPLLGGYLSALRELRAEDGGAVVLLDGGRPWQALAHRKVEELQGRIAELEQTTALLRSALECGCRSLETCGKTAHLATQAGPAAPSLRTAIGAQIKSG